MQIRSRFLRVITWLLSLGFTGVIFGCLAVIGLFYMYSHDLPDPGKLAKYEPPIVTRLYANNGKLLAEYATEHRLYLPLGAMPKRLINAFLASEDKDFYRHDGVDFMSIARAIVTNINNYGQGRAMVGGSTITQQVVKNFLLTNERSFERKIKEAILAFRMDRIYTKDRILELYLNEIYLGLRSYGVAAAALNYFNKSLEELTIAEVAFLAGLPKGPANYNPNQNYERAMNRRSYVLKRMYANGFITAEEMKVADSSPITTRERDKSEVASADFFAEEVRRKLAEQYGQEVLYEGGLFVKTTVDPKTQKLADNALRKALSDYDRRHGWRGPIAHFPNFSEWKLRIEKLAEKTPVFDNQRLAMVKTVEDKQAILVMSEGKQGKLRLSEVKWARKYVSETIMGGAVKKVSDVLRVGDVVLIDPIFTTPEAPAEEPKETGAYKLLQIPKVNGALVAMDPHSGQVMAMSGGYSYQGSEFNRATQAKRQPGSAFKPFVYLAGIESGMTPATKLMDGPISIPQGPDRPDWKPQNYSGDFLGSVTMRMGLERSRNAMTVYLASLLGIERIQEIGKRFGIYDDLPPHYATVLGSQETTLMRLVNAYAILVNGGKKVEPQLIERIDDRYGNIVFRRDNRECKNCSYRDDIPPEMQKAPPELKDDRETVVDAASAYQTTYMLQGVVERGTARRAKALGMPLGGKTGTTNDSRDAWFIGFSSDLVVGLYIGFDQPKPLGPKETGSSVALPGFVNFMETALDKNTVRPFSMPEGIRLYKIDRWTGRPPYVGSPAKNIIYEAFKYYESPNHANRYGNETPYQSKSESPKDTAGEGYQPGIAATTPPTRPAASVKRGAGWDYSTQQPKSNRQRPPSGYVVPGNENPGAPARGHYYDEAPNYVERAQQLQRQREVRGSYDNGVTGGRYYDRQPVPVAPRAPQQGYGSRQPTRPPASAYGTGGLY
ncbi:MAG: penicillin-binding protein 1A [Rickettsiales bacterium]|nr:penicillin-binding protein 1A [Rickettsiales bacterium]